MVSTLYAFTGYNDGDQPSGALVSGVDGNFYGTTSYGGAGGHGTVFKIAPGGQFTSLYSFAGGNDGDDPTGSLASGSDGNLYGVTYLGGPQQQGSAYRITPAGAFTSLYIFTGGDDGSHPGGPLLAASDGNFYGTTFEGGKGGAGTVFRLTPKGDLTTLYAFTGGQDGGTPQPGLVQGGDGNFYGVTNQGGSSGDGTVYRLTPAGALTTLHTFTGGGDGAAPSAGLLLAGDGNFYGSTLDGPGDDGGGTVYKLTIAGELTTLYAFQTGAEGKSPQNTLLQAADGSFYGTTSLGGSGNAGAIFRLAPDGTLSAVHSDNNLYPGGLVQGPDSNLYGVAAGFGNYGLIIKITLAAPGTHPAGVTVVVAGDGLAIEGGQNGKVSVQRTGDLSAALTVRYKIKGTAKADVDYKGLPGTVTIPAGAARAKIKIKPIDNATADGVRTAKVKLLPATDDSYLLDGEAAAGIKIIPSFPSSSLGTHWLREAPASLPLCLNQPVSTSQAGAWPD